MGENYEEPQKTKSKTKQKNMMAKPQKNYLILSLFSINALSILFKIFSLLLVTVQK